MHALARLRLCRWPSVLGVVLAYVLVVQALVAPLHALSGVTLAGDRSLAVICLSLDRAAVPHEDPVQQADMDCCDQGCLSALSWFFAPVRGASAVLPVVLVLGTQQLKTGLAHGFLPPERSSGQRHSPRAPPISFAVI